MEKISLGKVSSAKKVFPRLFCQEIQRDLTPNLSVQSWRHFRVNVTQPFKEDAPWFECFQDLRWSILL